MVLQADITKHEENHGAKIHELKRVKGVTRTCARLMRVISKPSMNNDTTSPKKRNRVRKMPVIEDGGIVVFPGSLGQGFMSQSWHSLTQ